MLAMMVALMSAALVGAVVTMRMISGVPDLMVTEAPIAANFVRYTEAARCYARANPGFNGAVPDITVLKAATFLGAPCLHPSINFVGDYRGIITASKVMVYQPTGVTIRMLPVPAKELAMYAATKYEVTGIIGQDTLSIISPSGGVVGQLPPELQAASPRPAVGAPVRVLSRG